MPPERATTEPAPGVLERLGLHRPALRAWALYDWANSAFVLTITTAIFPIYFADVAAAGVPGAIASRRYAWVTAGALAAIALVSPVLGAIADWGGLRKRFLGIFLALGVAATASLWFVETGDWVLAAALFAAANIGAQGAFVFYDSLLPHIAKGHEMDRVSTVAYALGYLGSSILFVVQIAAIQSPGAFGLPEGTLATRLAFVATAAWWLAFSIPLFRRVPEPARRIEPDEPPAGAAVRVAFSRLAETFRELRLYRHALLMLVAFLVYNDGIGTIMRLATVYARELEISRGSIVVSLLIAQLVGVPCAIAFSGLAGRFGPKPTILFGIAVYAGIAGYAVFLTTATQFFVLAALVGTVQGGTQAISRSLFASLVPRHKSSEFFGFYGVLDKFAGILGPALFALTSTLTGSSRAAIAAILAFFVIGGLLLLRVDVDEGRRAAREADLEALPPA